MLFPLWRLQLEVICTPRSPVPLPAIDPDRKIALIWPKQRDLRDSPVWHIDDQQNIIGPWLGGYRPHDYSDSSSQWMWVTRDPWGYTNWAPGEPNNLHGNEERLIYYSFYNIDPQYCEPGSGCIQVVRYSYCSGDYWNDFSRNDRTNGYIVEFEKGAVIPPTSLSANFKTTLFWLQQSQGGTGPWTGAFQASDGWNWVTGEQPTPHAIWAPGEPNNPYSGENVVAFCGFGGALKGSAWPDLPDNTRLNGFIVEFVDLRDINKQIGLNMGPAGGQPPQVLQGEQQFWPNNGVI